MAGDQAEPAPEDLVGARVVADVIRVLRAVREIGQPLGAGTEAMRDASAGRPRDDVAAPYRVRFLRLRCRGRAGFRRAPELEGPLALEHDEYFLVSRMAMRRRAPLVRGHGDLVEPRLSRPAGGADPPRDPAEVSLDVLE